MLNYNSFLVQEFASVQLGTYKRNMFLALGKQRLDSEDYEIYEALVVYGDVDRLYEIINSEEDNMDPLIESYIYDYFLNEESLLQKGINWFKRKKEQIQKGGKEVLQKLGDGAKALIKMGGDLLKPVKAMLQKLVAWAKNAWSTIIAKAKARIKEKVQEELKPRINSLLKNKPDAVAEEVGYMKDLGSWAASYFTGGIKGTIVQSAQAAAKSNESVEEPNVLDSFEITLEASAYAAITHMIERDGVLIEEMEAGMAEWEKGQLETEDVNEGGGEGKSNEKYRKIPFLSTLMDKIGHMPPFKWFHKMGEFIKGKFNNMLTGVSAFLAERFGAPGPFEFMVCGGIVGAVAGYMLESKTKSAVKGLLIKLIGHLAPWMYAIFTVIKWTGAALLAYGLIKELYLSVNLDKDEQAAMKKATAGEIEVVPSKEEGEGENK